MKYIILPIIRAVLTIILLSTVLSAFILVFSMLALWHWDKSWLNPVSHIIKEEFIVQWWVPEGNEYWIYKSPWDYIRGKKTFKVKEKVNTTGDAIIRRREHVNDIADRRKL